MKKATRYLLLWLLSMGAIYITIFLLATAKCLIIKRGWEMRQQEYNGRTILTFHRKP